MNGLLLGHAEFPHCTAHGMTVYVVRQWLAHPEREDVVIHAPFMVRKRVVVIPCRPGDEIQAPMWIVTRTG